VLPSRQLLASEIYTLNKLGGISEEKTNEFVLFFPRFALTLSEKQQQWK